MGRRGDRAIKPFGIIVNFTDRTIKGLRPPGDEIKLTYVNEMSIGLNSTVGGSWTFSGSIDRVTGELQATETQKLSQSETLTAYILLKCKPTQRML